MFKPVEEVSVQEAARRKDSDTKLRESAIETHMSCGMTRAQAEKTVDHFGYGEAA